MKHLYTVPLAVPLDKVDLSEWLFGLTDDEYRACAHAHHAMGVVGGVRRLGLINVEEVGGALLVQHYATQESGPHRVAMLSEASEGYLMRLVPFRARVLWEMHAFEDVPGETRLECAVAVETPAWVRFAGALVAASHFLKQHLIEETRGFARDITAKQGHTGR